MLDTRLSLALGAIWLADELSIVTEAVVTRMALAYASWIWPKGIKMSTQSGERHTCPCLESSPPFQNPDYGKEALAPHRGGKRAFNTERTIPLSATDFLRWARNGHATAVNPLKSDRARIIRTLRFWPSSGLPRAVHNVGCLRSPPCFMSAAKPRYLSLLGLHLSPSITF